MPVKGLHCFKSERQTEPQSVPPSPSTSPPPPPHSSLPPLPLGVSFPLTYKWVQSSPTWKDKNMTTVSFPSVSRAPAPPEVHQTFMPNSPSDFHHLDIYFSTLSKRKWRFRKVALPWGVLPRQWLNPDSRQILRPQSSQYPVSHRGSSGKHRRLGKSPTPSLGGPKCPTQKHTGSEVKGEAWSQRAAFSAC